MNFKIEILLSDEFSAYRKVGAFTLGNDKMMKVVIIFGGRSSEYEVSLKTTTSILNHINRDKYDIMTIGITKDGRWFLYSGPYENIATDTWQSSRFVRPAMISPDYSKRGIYILRDDQTYNFIGADIIFPVLHGKNGEDGTVQGGFELSGIPYVGCDLISSANCMDKEFAHIIMERHGIPMAKWVSFRKADIDDFEVIAKETERTLGYPVFVKPANAGSSVGVTKVHDMEELKEAFDTAFLHDKKLLVEEAIEGAEVECAVLGNQTPTASVLGEIVPTAEFYDYDAKYNDKTTMQHIPARIDKAISDKVRQTALLAYKVMECKGLSRVDFFVRQDGSIILSEVNTLPGFTEISMYPKLREAGGLSYSELIDELIRLGMERNVLLG